MFKKTRLRIFLLIMAIATVIIALMLSFIYIASLTIVSAAGNGITTKDDMKIADGNYIINCAKDGLEANDSISIYGGQFIINSDKDAIHCENDKQQGVIYIKNGTFILEAEDDGINAARKSNDNDVIIEINGGEITIVMEAGDTDGLDANGIIVVNGGTIDVSGRSTFDADIGTIYNGGTIIINGTITDTIPVSDMGGPGRAGETGDGSMFHSGNRGNRNVW